MHGIDPEPALTLGSILLRLGVAVVLVLANGFFVAAEFALVGARKTRIDALADAGNRRARLARSAIARLDHYISGTQLGITLASLGLGWVGESTIAVVLIQLFEGLPEPWNVLGAHSVAIVVAFLLITVLHIVLGELAPKSMALLFPEATSLWTAGPLIAFSRLLTPFIAFLNGAANLLLRMVGLRPPTEMERIHRPEEIELLLTQSYRHGLLAEEPVDMIRGVFDLSETTAAAVMTPRIDLIAVPRSASLQEAADIMLEAGHSRVPVYEDSLDRIVGVLLAREVWRAQRNGDTALGPLIRPLTYVPDTKPVETLLREMQQGRTHMAVVVDEFGGTAGIVTIEDLIEEIVGEIVDEHEHEPPPLEETPAGEVLMQGWVPVAEINERYHLELPEEDYTTVAGFIMGRLGRIARTGDEVPFTGGVLRVVGTSGRRIERVELTLSHETVE